MDSQNFVAISGLRRTCHVLVCPKEYEKEGSAPNLPPDCSMYHHHCPQEGHNEHWDWQLRQETWMFVGALQSGKARRCHRK